MRNNPRHADEEVLARFSETGICNTRRFSVDADVTSWELRWNAVEDDNPIFDVRRADENGEYWSAAHGSGTQVGRTCVHVPGRFYLDACVNGPWTVVAVVLERASTGPVEALPTILESPWVEAGWVYPPWAQRPPELDDQPADTEHEYHEYREYGESAEDALANMVGLQTVKDCVLRLKSHLVIQGERQAAGLPANNVAKHLVFTGNPGTGKTEVARVIARLYFEMGLTRRDHLEEADRSRLVAAYVGQTAVKTREVIERARGGVLFIDEAYTLSENTSTEHNYGHEAIATLLKLMEDLRHDLVVIVAGYPNEMRRFLDSNPGLRSRFAQPWRFPDYATSELSEILRRMAARGGYLLPADTECAFADAASSARKAVGFSNGRWVRNTLEQALVRHADRLVTLPRRTVTDLQLLLPVDLPTKQTNHEVPADLIAETLLDLDQLVGLAGVKEEVRVLVALQSAQTERRRQGLAVPPISNHLVFSGPPGTGKTTVARILARLLGALGVVSHGNLVETSRSDLVAGYVGQTAIKTAEVVASAIGGVLFIDEAYTLAGNGASEHNFGQEAIDTLLKLMEDHRDDLVVIAAGYPHEMEVFLNSNPGLRSRFSRTIVFPDFTDDELVATLQAELARHGLRHHGSDRVLADAVAQLRNNPEFANARSIRTLVQDSLRRQAVRLHNCPDNDADMSDLHEQDIAPNP